MNYIYIYITMNTFTFVTLHFSTFYSGGHHDGVSLRSTCCDWRLMLGIQVPSGREIGLIVNPLYQCVLCILHLATWHP